MHPIIYKIGPLTVYSYGMMVAIAFLVGISIARIEARRKDINPELIYDFGFYLVIGSIIAARLYYILFFNLQGFLEDPLSIFKVWQGGLSIHGAILGGIIAGIVFSKARKINFWNLADLISPSIILGQAIGRIGCFLNGCCFGVPTRSMFGIRFPKGSLADIAYGGLAVHPTQIYELILNLIGFLMLWGLRKRIRFDGGIFLLYLMMYAVIRIIVSQFRGDNLYIWPSNFKLADLSSIIIFIIAIGLYIKRKHA
jgi:phosphatidylglycerol:prolipoprotein diacylglycerol transferase